MKWSSEEDRILHLLVEKGVSLEDMSRVLKSRSRDAISRRLRRLGLVLQEHTPVIDWDALQELTI